MLGDFNIHIDKPKAAHVHTLLASFDLKRVLTLATHKPGNQRYFIYTRHCSTDHVLVTPLHTSDHFLLTLNLNMIPDTSHTPPHVTYRRTTYARSHPPGNMLWFHLHFLPLNSYHILMLTVLLILSAPLLHVLVYSTLTSCLDTVRSLSSKPARTTPSAPWLSDVLCKHRSKLRAAERVWRKSKKPIDLNVYQSLLSAFSANIW